MAVTRRNSVSKKIENAWNKAWDGAKNDAKKLQVKVSGLSFYGRNKSSIFAPASVKLVSYNIKQAIKQVEKAECTAMDAVSDAKKAECTAMDAVKDAKKARQALVTVSSAVERLRTKGTKGTVATKTKKRKTKSSTTTAAKKTKKTRKTRTYRAA